MENNPELQLAWQFIENTGTHLFLTGKAGTGKTTFLRRLKEQQAIEALHALPRLPRSGASLERMQALLDHLGNERGRRDRCVRFYGRTAGHVKETIKKNGRVYHGNF